MAAPHIRAEFIIVSRECSDMSSEPLELITLFGKREGER